jgi:hypothetical protein
VISAAGNSNKFQKTRFSKEKSVEEVLTLEANGIGHTSHYDLSIRNTH